MKNAALKARTEDDLQAVLDIFLKYDETLVCFLCGKGYSCKASRKKHITSMCKKKLLKAKEDARKETKKRKPKENVTSCTEGGEEEQQGIQEEEQQGTQEEEEEQQGIQEEEQQGTQEEQQQGTQEEEQQQGTHKGGAAGDSGGGAGDS